MQASLSISTSISHRFLSADILGCFLGASESARQEALQQMEAMTSGAIAMNKFSYTAGLSACEKGPLPAAETGRNFSTQCFFSGSKAAKNIQEL